MEGVSVMQQSPVLMILSNQVKATGAKYAADEVVPEKAFTKDVTDKAYASTTMYTHHQSVTSR